MGMKKRLVVLVGSNPLPDYLAARLLEPQRVALMYSEQTLEPKERLRRVLESGRVEADDVYVDDACSAHSVRRACRDLFTDAHLHYTGGTKPMAAHARLEFERQGGKPAEASYLDDRKGVLLFDDGRLVTLDGRQFELSLKLLAELHGLKLLKPRTVVAEEDWEERANQVLRQLKTVKEAGERGDWLDLWAAARVRKAAPDAVVEIGVNATHQGRQFDLDVVVIRGHRLYVISCTTDETRSLCKSKLFEVAVRAQQLGGGLARSALVCLADSAVTADVQQDVAASWGAWNTPKVFGRPHLEEWLGVHSGEPNLEGVQSWLRS